MFLATKENEVGEAVVDWQTPIEFGVGAAAGALGVSPVIATLVFLTMDALKLAASEGMTEALFRPGVGQSHANLLMDNVSKLAGFIIGAKARSLIKGQATSGLGGKIVGVSAPSPAGTSGAAGDSHLLRAMAGQR